MISDEVHLPVRIVEVNGMPVIRCLCGAELAAVTGRDLRPEFSPAGLLRMILHARGCKYPLIAGKLPLF